MRDDIIVMRDENRNLTGKRHHLFEGEDPRQVAYRLMRESWKARAPDFSRQLNYQPSGIA